MPATRTNFALTGKTASTRDLVTPFHTSLMTYLQGQYSRIVNGAV